MAIGNEVISIADLRACACGHLPHIDQSKRFNADAEAFYPWLRGNGLTRLGGASPLDCPLLRDNA